MYHNAVHFTGTGQSSSAYLLAPWIDSSRSNWPASSLATIREPKSFSFLKSCGESALEIISTGREKGEREKNWPVFHRSSLEAVAERSGHAVRVIIITGNLTVVIDGY